MLRVHHHYITGGRASSRQSLRHSLSSRSQITSWLWRPRRERQGPRGKRARDAQAIFSGIVQGSARVIRKEGDNSSGAVRLTVEFPEGALTGVERGGSVALNGACLTVTEAEPEDSRARFDVVPETLRMTNLANVDEGVELNFERSARVGDEIGGHLVAGHVHGKAELKEANEEQGGDVRWVLAPDEGLMKYILRKGFIAVDGASLTIGEVGENWFSVYLIPETLQQTTFSRKPVGSVMNLEIDQQTQAIVDTVERYLASRLD